MSQQSIGVCIITRLYWCFNIRVVLPYYNPGITHTLYPQHCPLFESYSVNIIFNAVAYYLEKIKCLLSMEIWSD